MELLAPPSVLQEKCKLALESGFYPPFFQPLRGWDGSVAMNPKEITPGAGFRATGTGLRAPAWGSEVNSGNLAVRRSFSKGFMATEPSPPPSAGVNTRFNHPPTLLPSNQFRTRDVGKTNRL